jgi:hypothetical protein
MSLMIRPIEQNDAESCGKVGYEAHKAVSSAHGYPTEQPPSSDFESDESDIDDAIGNKTKTNSTNTKGSIQIDKENTGSSDSTHFLKSEKDHCGKRDGFTPESDEMDESDVTGVNTKDGVVTSDDSLQTGGESGEYSHNTPIENEETVKENNEIIDRHPSEDAIEATQATHPTPNT